MTLGEDKERDQLNASGDLKYTQGIMVFHTFWVGMTLAMPAGAFQTLH